MGLERFIFIGGMDSDTEERLLGQGDYRTALNVRNSSPDNQNSGSVENVLGNLKVHFTLPGGVNDTIGSVEDLDNNRIIYFNWNSLGQHQILEYDFNKEQITEILKSSVLDFDRDSKIWHINVIEDNILKWTDGNSEPKSIDINLAKAGGYPSPLLEEHITAIRQPSLCPPEVEFGDDLTKRTNNLRGDFWQIRYRYVYPNNEKSVWSPHSKKALPQGEFLSQSGFFIPAEKNNVLRATIKTDNPFAEKIELSARRNEEDWFFINSLDISALNTPEHVFSFYNDEVYSLVEPKDSINIFDRIPKKARTQEYVDGNRIVYGNIQEGFDLEDIDVNFTPLYNGIPAITNPVVDTSFQDLANTHRIEYDLVSSTVSLGELYEFSFDVDWQLKRQFPDGSTVTITVPKFTVSGSDVVQAGETANDVLGVIKTQFEDNYYFNNTLTFTNTSKGDFSFNFGAFKQFFLNITIQPNEILRVDHSEFLGITDTAGGGWQLISETSNPQVNTLAVGEVSRSFKRKATHKFGIIYSDKFGRVSTVFRDDALTVYVDDFNESVPGQRGSVDMAIEINHTPPVWAEKYQIVYTGNQSIARFVQFEVGKVSKKGNNKLKLSLQPILDYKDDFENSIISYGFSEGDRVVYHKFPSAKFVGSQVETEVLGFDESSGELEIIVPKPDIVVTAGSFVEIFSPKKETQEVIYYEIGECFDIDLDGPFRIHKTHDDKASKQGITEQDQTSTTPAIIILQNQGDIYYKRRIFSKTTTEIEDANFSDFYNSAFWNRGRPNVFDANAKERFREATIRYTEPFVPDTNINQLNTVFDLNFQEYDKNFGGIQRLYSENRRLVCFQELKVGQILVNESVVTDRQAEQTIFKSDEVLADIIYYAGEYGISVDPGSFGFYGHRIYFTDRKRGSVLRLSRDGITNISDYNFRQHFRERFQLMETMDDVVIQGEFHKRHEEYVLTAKFGRRLTGQWSLSNGQWSLVFNNEVDLTEFIEDEITVSFYDFFTKKNVTVTYSNITVTSNEIAVADINDFTSVFGITQVQINDGDSFSTDISRQETLAFNEPKNRWTSFYSYLPESMIKYATELVTFRAGELYLHDKNTQYNTFYDETFSSEIIFIAKENPVEVKFLEAIEQQSTDIWDVNVTTRENQKTNLIPGDFETIENNHWAAFWKDENTSSTTNPLLEGDDVRSTSFVVKLTVSSIKLVKMFSAAIRTQISMRTNA